MRYFELARFTFLSCSIWHFAAKQGENWLHPIISLSLHGLDAAPAWSVMLVCIAIILGNIKVVVVDGNYSDISWGIAVQNYFCFDLAFIRLLPSIWHEGYVVLATERTRLCAFAPAASIIRAVDPCAECRMTISCEEKVCQVLGILTRCCIVEWNHDLAVFGMNGFSWDEWVFPLSKTSRLLLVLSFLLMHRKSDQLLSFVSAIIIRNNPPHESICIDRGAHQFRLRILVICFVLKTIPSRGTRYRSFIDLASSGDLNHNYRPDRNELIFKTRLL